MTNTSDGKRDLGKHGALGSPLGGAGTWIARHKEIAFGGTGAAVLGALLTWGLSGAPTQTSVAIQNQGGQTGPVVTGPVAGDVIGQQTTVHGVPFDKYEQIPLAKSAEPGWAGMLRRVQSAGGPPCSSP